MKYQTFGGIYTQCYPGERRHTRTLGKDEIYDTLDDFPDESLVDIETLHQNLIAPTSGAVGVVVGGQCVLCDPSTGYWGRAFRMLSGEYIQVCVCPRGSAHRPLNRGETRIIAVRRTSGGLAAPHVSFAILFLPESCLAADASVPLSAARTIGCRGVQLLLPSLFGKHDPHRDRTTGHANIDLAGFHTVRPSTLAVTKRVGGAGTVSLAVSPGESYLVVAGHLCGVDVPDPLVRSVQTVDDAEHKRRIARITRLITKAVGEDEAAQYVSASLAIIELLGVEGIVGMLCHSFFKSALPDMMHSPVGLVLCVVMASRIASRPDRFGLPACTDQDVYANREACTAFESRWDPVVANGYRAIDVAIASGLDNAKAQSGASAMRQFVQDNLVFWQRVGQRINSKVMSDPHDDRHSAAAVARHETRFGEADLLRDVVSDAKYAYLARENKATPVREAPVRQVNFATRSEMRTTFHRMTVAVEAWMRDGMYGSTRLSAPNVNVVARGKPCERGEKEDRICSDSESTSDDEDDVLDNKLCKDAMESAAGAISVALVHGAFVIHQYGIETFVVGKGCHNTCADCDASVNALEGVLLKSKLGECPSCNRRRCYACASKAASMFGTPQHCKRCSHGTTQPLKKPSEAK